MLLANSAKSLEFRDKSYGNVFIYRTYPYTVHGGYQLCGFFFYFLVVAVFFFGGGEIRRQLLVVVSTLVDLFLGLEIVRTNKKFYFHKWEKIYKF